MLSGTNRCVGRISSQLGAVTQRTSAISPSVNVNGPSCTTR